MLVGDADWLELVLLARVLMVVIPLLSVVVTTVGEKLVVICALLVGVVVARLLVVVVGPGLLVGVGVVSDESPGRPVPGSEVS